MFKTTSTLEKTPPEPRLARFGAEAAAALVVHGEPWGRRSGGVLQGDAEPGSGALADLVSWGCLEKESRIVLLWLLF